MRRRIFYGLLQTDDGAAKEIRLFGLGDHFLGRFLREFRVLNDGGRRMDRAVLRRRLALGAMTGALGAGGSWLLVPSTAGSPGEADGESVSISPVALLGVGSGWGGRGVDAARPTRHHSFARTRSSCSIPGRWCDGCRPRTHNDR